MFEPATKHEDAPVIVDGAAAPTQPFVAIATLYEDRDGKPAMPYTELPAAGDDAASKNTSRSRSSHRSGRSRQSSRSRDSMASRGQARIAYKTSSTYDVRAILVLCLPIVLILNRMVLVYAKDAQIADFQRSQTVWILGWSMVMILGIYMMVLPKELNIRMNGSVGIKTFLFTYHFTDVCHVYQAEGTQPSCIGASFRFATSLGTPPVILRRRNKWDVVVTPTKASEFLQTFESVLTRLEIQRENAKNGSKSGTDQPPVSVVTTTIV